MKIIYFQDPRGNFGDELNRWLWPRIFGDEITSFGHHGIETRAENNAQDLLFYGIGTILDDRIPQEPEKIVFGSGVGYGKAPKNLEGFNIFFVRGKGSAQALRIAPDKALTDPAILLRRFFPLIPDEEKVHDVSFIPHHSTAGGGFWREACNALRINYIDPMGFDVEKVIKDIAGSRLLIAEAMHGAIVADAFRVPWIAVTSVAETNNFKWRDWCGTLDLDYAPVRLTPIFRNTGRRPWKAWLNAVKQAMRKRELAAVLRSRGKALLSDSRLLDAHMARMDARVVELQNYLLRRGSA